MVPKLEWRKCGAETELNYEEVVEMDDDDFLTTYQEDLLDCETTK